MGAVVSRAGRRGIGANASIGRDSYGRLHRDRPAAGLVDGTHRPAVPQAVGRVDPVAPGGSQLRGRVHSGGGAGAEGNAAAGSGWPFRHRAPARHPRFCRRAADPDFSQLPLCSDNAESGPVPHRPGLGGIGPGVGIGTVGSLLPDHLPAVEAGHLRRRTSGGPVHSERLRGRVPASIRDLHLGHFRAVRLGPRPHPRGGDCRWCW